MKVNGQYINGISMNDLADKVQQQGLGNRHRWIKLHACYSGGVASVDTDGEDATVTAKVTHAAAVLAQALGQRKPPYSSIRVGGYAGALAFKGDGSLAHAVKADVRGSDDTRVALDGKASQYLFWFDCAGKQVGREAAS
jgi:hypothetical protein